MIAVQISPLPPGVRAETFTYSNGKQETIYRAPYESDGPRLLNENESRVLTYMYAAYVFRWREMTTKVDIGHGSIDDYIDLWSGVPIAGRWHPDTLTSFAHKWTANELRKFAR